mmetsp:Transcript_17301/g.44151  ORF Transcript_17301/g.44151 Transcript_17301/m.44151 type:complete len:270 (-) Transcript_17301:355-1164(-)
MGEKHRVSPRRNELQDPLHEARQHFVVDDDLVNNRKQCLHLILKILGNRCRQLLKHLAQPRDIFDGLPGWHLKQSFHLHDLRSLRQNLLQFRGAFKRPRARHIQPLPVPDHNQKRVAGKKAAQHLDPAPREGKDVLEPAEEEPGLVPTKHPPPRKQARADGSHLRHVLPPRILQQRQKRHPPRVSRVVPQQPTPIHLGKTADRPHVPRRVRRRHPKNSPRRSRRLRGYLPVDELRLPAELQTALRRARCAGEQPGEGGVFGEGGFGVGN